MEPIRSKLIFLIRTIAKAPRFWLLLLGAAIGLFGFIELVDDVFWDPLEGDDEASHLDRAIFAEVNTWRTKELTQVMIDMTALGSISVICLLSLIVGSILWMVRDRLALVHLMTVFIGAGVWPAILKPIFGRERPEELEKLVNVASLSFPSGHSFGSAAVYSALAFFAARYAKNLGWEVFFYVMAAVLIGLVGLSRIYLGVHFPTDVLAGISGGLAWSFLATAIALKFERGNLPPKKARRAHVETPIPVRG